MLTFILLYQKLTFILLYYYAYFYFTVPGLTMADHGNVTRHLVDLNNEELVALGSQLGLSYPRMRRMTWLMGDMVAAKMKMTMS